MPYVLASYIQHPPSGSIALLTLNRPRVRNALNKALCQNLARLLAEVRTRKDVVCVILCGAEGSFSAGVDLKDPVFSDSSYVNRDSLTGPESYLWQLQQVKVPIIAAISGPCITGGLEIALNCDILVCDDTAVFRDTHAIYGITPAGGMTQLLPRMIGLQAAKYMSLTGEKIGAHRAFELGLVSEVVRNREQLMIRATQIAHNVGKMNTEILANIKELQHRGLGYDVPKALSYELDTALNQYEEMAQKGSDTTERLRLKFSQQSKL